MAISVYLVLCVGMMTANFCTGIQFGRCNDTFFLTKAMNCENTFYRKLVLNSSLNNCSQLYKVHVYDCYKETLLQCYRDAITNWQLPVRVGLLTMDAIGQAQFYCSANTTIGKLSEMPDEVRKNFPCSKEYLEEGKKCADKVRNILVKNPRDRALCKEYSRSVLCTQRVAKAYCNTTLEISEDLVENPFCPEEEIEGDGKESDGKEGDGKEDDGKEEDGKEDDGKENDGKEDDGKENAGKEDDGKENVTEIASKQLTEDKNNENAEAIIETEAPSTSLADVHHLACGGWFLVAMLCFLSCNA